jgi:hypothetical protein
MRFETTENDRIMAGQNHKILSVTCIIIYLFLA